MWFFSATHKIFPDMRIRRGSDCVGVRKDSILFKAWRYHSHLRWLAQINWRYCAASISFGSGVRSMRNVTVWFAAKLLLAGTFK